MAFHAARHALPPARVFEEFSPYLTSKVDEKKKQRDPAWAKREAVCEAISGGHYYYWERRQDNEPPLDPRWLDVAVKIKNIALVRQLGRPNHAAAIALLKQAFDETLKSSKSIDQFHEIIASMAHAQHPDTTDAFLAVVEKYAKKDKGHQNYIYYLAGLASVIPLLPKSALPKLEALVPLVNEHVADYLLVNMQRLRDRA
jgi:hypothetical protein